MRQRIKFILLLITSICYFNSVFEWDSKERKQNYEKESHSYITCVKTVDTSASHFATPIELEIFFVNVQPVYFVSAKPHAFSSLKSDDPPDKLYLLYLSLLI